MSDDPEPGRGGAVVWWVLVLLVVALLCVEGRVG